MCETMSVTSALYLRDVDNIPEDEIIGEELVIRDGGYSNYKKKITKKSDNPNEPEFIGRVGQFCPIKPGRGGGELVREELLREGKDKEGNRKFSAATGSKGYYWLESEQVKALGKEADIDRSYYDAMVNKAVETISLYGDFDAFVDVETVPEFKAHSEVLNMKACPLYREKTPDGEMDYCWHCPFRHSHDAEPWAEPDICEKGFDIHDLIPF